MPRKKQETEVENTELGDVLKLDEAEETQEILKIPEENTASNETPESEKTEHKEDTEPVKETAEAVKNNGSEIPGSVLTVEAGDEIESDEDRDALLWHDIQNSYRTRKILSGILSGLEKTETGRTIAVVDYNGLRAVIPIDEAVVIDDYSNNPNRNADIHERRSRIAGNMLGAEIDFVIKGIENKSRSVVASRKEAMMRKRQIFYFPSDNSKNTKISAGRIVQARVITVSEKGLRVEIFGAECPIYANALAREWIGDVRDKYNVGDRVLVKVTEISGDSAENLSVRANIRGAAPDTTLEDLKKCRIQGKYAGKVIGIYKGTVFLRLGVGVNAIAHSCRDERMPGKKDDVSFVVTKIDEENRVAVGTITRIIRQNI